MDGPLRLRHHVDRLATEGAVGSPESIGFGLVDRWASRAWGIRWPRRRVSDRARLSGTPMRHQILSGFPPLEVVLLPLLVVGAPDVLVLVRGAGLPQSLAPGQRRARWAVALAPVTPPADADRRLASRTRELPRLGRRHRSGVLRALHGRRRARSFTRLSVHRAAAAGDQEVRALTPGLHPQHARPACHTFARRRNRLRVTSGGSLLTSAPLAILVSA